MLPTLCTYHKMWFAFSWCFFFFLNPIRYMNKLNAIVRPFSFCFFFLRSRWIAVRYILKRRIEGEKNKKFCYFLLSLLNLILSRFFFARYFIIILIIKVAFLFDHHHHHHWFLVQNKRKVNNMHLPRLYKTYICIHIRVYIEMWLCQSRRQLFLQIVRYICLRK